MPDGYTSASFAELVLEQANVVVSPGNAYGPSGEGYVRLSLTVPDDRLQEAVSRIEALALVALVMNFQWVDRSFPTEARAKPAPPESETASGSAVVILQP